MTVVRARARLHEDRAGDPLDGLVNLFDVAVVLAVAFLLVALTALKTGQTSDNSKPTVVVPSPATTISPGVNTSGRGTPAGEVYRLQNGTLVYVPSTPTPSP